MTLSFDLTRKLFATPAFKVWVSIFILVTCAAAQDQPANDTDQPPAHRAAPGETILLNFQDATLQAVLDHLSEVAGLSIVQAADMPGRITVVSRQPVTVDQAVQILNTALKLKGVAAVRMGNTLKIIPLSQVGAANMPVYIGNNPDRIADSDEVITQVIPLRSVKALQLMNDLKPILSESASVTANADSNTLVVTDSSSNIKRLVSVIAAMDTVQPGAMDVRVFPLKYARASDAARLVNEVFNPQATGSDDPRQQAVQAWFQRQRGDDGPQAQSVVGTSIPTASADDRTNTLVVSGSPEVLNEVARVVAELDANPAVTQGVFIYEVRNGQALNLETVLNNLFGTSTGDSRSTVDGAQTGYSARPGASGRQVETPSPFAPGGSAAQQQGGRASLFDAMRQGLSAQLSTDSLQNAGDLYGQVYSVADEDSNSLLVMTAPSHFPTVQKILEELDSPVPQVLIKVLIAEVTHSDGLDLGVEWSILNAPDDSTLGTDFGVAAAAISPLVPGGLVYKYLSGDFTATIRALEQVGKLEILSRPYILASDNQIATITVGSEVPFVTSTQFTEEGTSNSSVRYEDVGIILNVTPHIGPDGKVTMDVAPEISQLSGDTVQVSEDLELPIIQKRSASTRVAINDGQTIVIGGLMEDSKTDSIDKVPLLGDLPLVGALFRRTQTDKSKTELLIFLTPHIAEDPGKLQPMTQDELRGVQIIPDAVREGAYQQHMEGMQRGSANPAPAQSNQPMDVELAPEHTPAQ